MPWFVYSFVLCVFSHYSYVRIELRVYDLIHSSSSYFLFRYCIPGIWYSYSTSGGRSPLPYPLATCYRPRLEGMFLMSSTLNNRHPGKKNRSKPRTYHILCTYDKKRKEKNVNLKRTHITYQYYCKYQVKSTINVSNTRPCAPYPHTPYNTRRTINLINTQHTCPASRNKAG